MEQEEERKHKLSPIFMFSSFLWPLNRLFIFTLTLGFLFAFFSFTNFLFVVPFTFIKVFLFFLLPINLTFPIFPNLFVLLALFLRCLFAGNIPLLLLSSLLS